MLDLRKKDLESQGYRLIGNHSGVKICLWCKKSLRGGDVCYKNKFYGIQSWRCIQASVSLDVCNLRCNFCWRDVSISSSLMEDSPGDIVDGFIEEHKKILMGFKGKVNEERFREAMKPRHVALSLSGESCLYPKLPELIDEISSRGLTSFLVSNGTFPGMIKRLVKSDLTQLYITLPAFDKESFLEICRPYKDKLWDSILESLKLLEKFKRSVIRLTLVKNVNMVKPEKYAEIFNKNKFKYLELKSAMNVGHAKLRLNYEEVPSFEEIKKFSERISELTKLKIIDEKKESRVVLMAEKDYEDRMLEAD